MAEDNEGPKQAIVVHRMLPDYKTHAVHRLSSVPGVTLFLKSPARLSTADATSPVRYAWPRLPQHRGFRKIVESLDSPEHSTCEEDNDVVPGRLEFLTETIPRWTASTPWLSPFQMLKDLDLCSGLWGHTWPEGACRVSLCGLPRSVSKEDLIVAMRNIPCPIGVSHELQFSMLTLLFGDEPFAVNPLAPIARGPRCGQSLAVAEFSTEQEARLFWALCAAGTLKVYGHRVGCLPDPSGYCTFGEAVVANFQYEDLETVKLKCPCCDVHNEEGQKHILRRGPRCVEVSPKTSTGSSLFLPFVTYSFTQRVLHHVPVFRKKKVEIKWLSELNGTILQFQSQEDAFTFCLAQRYRFKVNYRSNMMVEASFFRLGRRLTPCIIDPPCLPLVFNAITGDQSEPLVAPVAATSSVSASPRKVIRRSCLVASKKRARLNKVTPGDIDLHGVLEEAEDNPDSCISTTHSTGYPPLMHPSSVRPQRWPSGTAAPRIKVPLVPSDTAISQPAASATLQPNTLREDGFRIPTPTRIIPSGRYNVSKPAPLTQQSTPKQLNAPKVAAPTHPTRRRPPLQQQAVVHPETALAPPAKRPRGRPKGSTTRKHTSG